MLQLQQEVLFCKKLFKVSKTKKLVLVLTTFALVIIVSKKASKMILN